MIREFLWGSWYHISFSLGLSEIQSIVGKKYLLSDGQLYLLWVSIWHRLWRHFCLSLFCPPNLVLSRQYLHWPQSSFFRHPAQSPQNTRLRIPFPPADKIFTLERELTLVHCSSSQQHRHDSSKYLVIWKMRWKFQQNISAVDKRGRGQIMFNILPFPPDLFLPEDVGWGLSEPEPGVRTVLWPEEARSLFSGGLSWW